MELTQNFSFGIDCYTELYTVVFSYLLDTLIPRSCKHEVSILPDLLQMEKPYQI